MKKYFNKIILILFFLYIVIVFYILFGREQRYWKNLSLVEYIRFSSNIIPFKTIVYYIKAIIDNSINKSISIINLLGNLLLFFPMGIFLQYFFKIKNEKKLYIIILVLLIFIESIQSICRVGNFDIDDIILNFSGMYLGYYSWKCYQKKKNIYK